MISAAQSFPQVSQAFIESMFNHPVFRQKFFYLMNSSADFKATSHFSQKHRQTSQLIEEITETIYQNVISAHEQIRSKFQQEITHLFQQVQKLKDNSYQNIGRMDDVPKQFCEETILEDQQIFDMPSIQRTISFLKDKVREISQNSTVMLDPNQISKELKEKDQFFVERLSAQLTKMEQKLTSQHEGLQETINKKIQKQQRTINNILETLNELGGSDKKDKTAATLSSCKSATKLKNFFGFG